MNNSSSSSDSSSGIAILGLLGIVLGLLGIVFVTLKLTGYIDWSWWYVTLPFWGGFVIFFAIAIIWVIGWVALEIYKNKKAKAKAVHHKET